MYRTEFWTLWEKARVGYFERTASKHVYYLGWNRSPAQVGCIRQVLGPGALGILRGIGWRGRWEKGLGWWIHVNPWLIHVNVFQKPLQYCKVISLQLIKMNEKKKKLKIMLPHHPSFWLLEIYSEKAIISKDSWTLMFIAAIFTLARTCKQPKCSSVEECIKMWYRRYIKKIYTVKCVLHVRYIASVVTDSLWPWGL